VDLDEYNMVNEKINTSKHDIKGLIEYLGRSCKIHKMKESQMKKCDETKKSHCKSTPDVFDGASDKTLDRSIACTKESSGY
jgi:predicted nucleic acid-binding protein